MGHRRPGVFGRRTSLRPAWSAQHSGPKRALPVNQNHSGEMGQYPVPLVYPDRWRTSFMKPQFCGCIFLENNGNIAA
jgi:hypothetical protein